MAKTLIIDPGHGGRDSGAVGISMLEKEWNLEMSLYQYSRLKELGARVELTRHSDLTLEPAQRIARVRNQYDYCLSNHFNAFNGEARGIEVIHSVHARPDFATDIARRLVDSTNLSLRRIFTRTIKPGVDYYFMNRMTGKTETVIVEYGFIDNEKDFAYYNNPIHFQKAAEAVIESLCLKLGIVYKSESAINRKEKPTNIVGKNNNSYKGKRVESIYAGELRFYSKPSWSDADVFGYLTKGIGFNEILDKVRVGRGEQFKVRNSRGEIYYLTASSVYVKVI